MTTNTNEIRSALNYVDSHDRDLWLKMGAALKDELGEEGFPVWDQWSSTAKNYDAKSTKATWKSLHSGHIRIGTLFYAAMQNGYQPNRNNPVPSAEEMAKRQAEAEQRRLQEAEAQKQAQEKAKQKAQYIWKERTTPASLLHPYLIAKSITNPDCIRGIKLNQYKDNQNLVIPMYHNKEIVSLQFISQNGEKHYLVDGQKIGSYALIGDAKNMSEGFYLAEGFATGASVHEATGKPVVVTFDAGNLVHVAQNLKPHYPNTPITFAADNDSNGQGIKKANQAAEIIGENARIICPEFTEEQIQRYQVQHGEDNLPTDFNDLHALEGLEAVTNLLNKERIPIMEPTNQATTPQAADQAAFLTPEPTEEKKPAKAKKAIMNSIEPDMERLQAKINEPQSATQTSSVTPEPEKASDNPPDKVRPTEPIPEVHKVKATEPIPEATPDNATQETEAKKPPLSNDDLKKIIIDLNYKMPPDGLERRYLVAGGQYLSVDNATTVLFEDKGKKLSTPRTDTQIAQDMLEVAKTKGWDAIKLSGTKEFKQTMYVLAESQGIKTRGYRPTEADKALVERLREERSLNSIEGVNSLYTQEKNKEPASPEDQKKTVEHGKPDVDALSKADKMMAQSNMPTTGQIETSPKADTDVDVPLQEIGQGKIPSEVVQQAKNLKTHALDTDVVTTAKATYDKKAARLSIPDKAKLKFYERNTMDVIRDLKGDARQNALRNYYEHMSEKMNGKTLNVPTPLQVPSPQVEQSRSPDRTQERDQQHEMER